MSLLVVLGPFPPAVQARAPGAIFNYPDLGAAFTVPNSGAIPAYGWPQALASFRSMKGTLAKFSMAPGFNVNHRHLQEAIDAGAQVIILQTSENSPMLPCRSRNNRDLLTSEEVIYQLTNSSREGRDTVSFLSFIRQNPTTMFWIEVGNEPDVQLPTMAYPSFDSDCDGTFTATDALVYRDYLNGIIVEMKARFPDKNLRWMAAMPTKVKWTELVLPGQTAADAIATHIYANFDYTSTTCVPNQDAEAGAFCDWKDNLDYILAHSDAKIFITEMGIRDAATDKATKARRTDEYIRRGLDDSRVIGIALWTLTPFHDNLCDCDRSGVVGDAVQDYPFLLESRAVGGVAQAETLADRFNHADYTVDGVTGRQRRAEFNTAYNQDVAQANGQWVYQYGRPLTDWDTSHGWQIENGWITQRFERNVFEWHPENMTHPTRRYRVLGRLLGRDRAVQLGYIDPKGDPICDAGTSVASGNCTRDGQPHPFDASRPGDHTSCRWFNRLDGGETGFSVCGHLYSHHFRAFGQELGDRDPNNLVAPMVSERESVGLWGYPISSQFRECDARGACHLVQYFQRAVFSLDGTEGQNEPWDWVPLRLGDNLGFTDRPGPVTVTAVDRPR